jgi:RNA polymerase sigma-70 factor (ECF subfamily)
MDETGTSPEDATDAALLAQLAYHPDVLEVLYQRWAPRLAATVQRAGVPTHAVGDVLQAVFTDIWREARRFDARRGSAAAWMYHITRRRTIDWMRRERPATRVPLDDDYPTASSEDPLDRVVVAHALESLSARERRLLQLAYWDGFTQQEIAQLWGVPLGTVKTWSRQAVMKLRRVMTPDSPDH